MSLSYNEEWNNKINTYNLLGDIDKGNGVGTTVVVEQGHQKYQKSDKG